MRHRAAFISILLLGAAWAVGAAPVAAQVPEPPPPPDIPKPDKPDKPEKPEKPEKPGKPQDPNEPPPVPEPPSTPTEPEPPTEPPPPADPPPGEDPPDDGSTGPGGGSPGGPRGAEPRASDHGERPGTPAVDGVRTAVILTGEGGVARRGLGHTDGPSAPGSGDGRTWVDRVVGNVLGSLEADASSPRLTAAVEDGATGGTGGLPLAVFTAGLLLVSVGLAAGAARARGVGQWQPPGSRPDST